MMRGLALLACFVLLGCNQQYDNITPTQCTEWSEISGFERDYFNGGYKYFDRVVCVIKQTKMSGPK
jgi:hypothetical protein